MKKLILILMIIGGINWGLIGFFNFNLVSAIFGGMKIIERIIYAAVGLASLWGISFLFKTCFTLGNQFPLQNQPSFLKITYGEL